MDSFLIWFLVFGVLSALGTVLWWVAIAFGVFKLVSLASRNFESQMRDNERLLRQLSKIPDTGGQVLAQMQVLDRLTKMNQQFSQLDNLHRQQYEVRMGEMANMAAQAGIDWKPPNYN